MLLGVPTFSTPLRLQRGQMWSGWSRGTWPGTSAWAFGAFGAQVGAKVGGAKAGAGGAFQAPGPGVVAEEDEDRMKIEWR